MSDKTKVLLLDDEYLAMEILDNYFSSFGQFEIIAKLTKPLEALEILQRGEVEVLFTDIQMPLLNGSNLLKILDRPPITIFTTAYSQYASEAYDLNVADYLVKPISFERFLKTLEKIKSLLPKKMIAEVRIEPMDTGFISLKADGILHKIPLEEILFIEGLKEYAKVVLQNGSLITFERLKNLEALLPPARFLRVHKSFIVARDKVKHLENNFLCIDKHFIPISREKKELVVKEIFGLTS